MQVWCQRSEPGLVGNPQITGYAPGIPTCVTWFAYISLTAPFQVWFIPSFFVDPSELPRLTVMDGYFSVSPLHLL